VLPSKWGGSFFGLRLHTRVLEMYECIGSGIYWIEIYIGVGVFFWSVEERYGVALVSRIDKMTSLFCKRALSKRRYSAKETCNLIDPTDRSHPI